MGRRNIKSLVTPYSQHLPPYPVPSSTTRHLTDHGPDANWCANSTAGSATDVYRQPVAVLDSQSVEAESSRKVGWQSNSVRRALAILELLHNSPRALSLSEISRVLALPKSTASLLLATLESVGYLTRHVDDRRYSPSLKAYGLGFGLLNHRELSRRAMPVLRAVAASLHVTAHIAVLDSDQALFVDKVDGTRQPCCDIYPGRRTNLNCTAVGKVLLAYMPEKKLREFLLRHHFMRHTSRTIASADALIGEVRRVRRVGYAYDDQEEELFVRCLAVPVFNPDGGTADALGITGSVNEIQPEDFKDLSEYMKQMSAQIFGGVASKSATGETALSL
jgi:DNA-binding IclR family transcriptional regulator